MRTEPVKPKLDYELSGTPSIVAAWPTIVQLLIALFVLALCWWGPAEALIYGGFPGSGTGLLCLGVFVLILVVSNVVVEFRTARMRGRRLSSGLSWGVIAAYVVLSIVVALS